MAEQVVAPMEEAVAAGATMGAGAELLVAGLQEVVVALAISIPA